MTSLKDASTDALSAETKTSSLLPQSNAQTTGVKKLVDSPTVAIIPLTDSLIISNIPLDEWRGSATTFNGFTGTKPVIELKEVKWTKAIKLLRPDKPTVIGDKKNGEYLVPCSLKEAPLVGKTLEAAKKNGDPATGKMRSKSHVTEAAMLIMDIDGLPEVDFEAGLEKIKNDGLTYLAYTTHSHGDPDKPGMRVRLAIPLDRPVSIEEYAATWQGFDQHYWQGRAGKADASGANLYQQQGTWCCHPDRVDQANSWMNDDGVASADSLIQIGLLSQTKSCQPAKPEQMVSSSGSISSSDKSFPPSNANKVADRCNQIDVFRKNKGANQSEPLWRDCLGITVHCTDGDTISQDWSSGHSGYNEDKTAKKIADRIKIPPTTCDQFRKTNSEGCISCIQKRNSPITLGRDKDEVLEDLGCDTIVLDDNSSCTVATDDHTNKPNSVDQAITNTAKPTPAPIVDDVVIAELAAMNPIEYDRIRAEKSKELGVQVKTLDDAVRKARKKEPEKDNSPFDKIEPWPEPVDPGQLLDEISTVFLRFLVISESQASTLALWVVHTYLIVVFNISPIALINAPEKACAKSLLLKLLSLLCYRPLLAANISSSALFRSIELLKPTILIDEADTSLRENKEFHGLINAGYERDGYVLRSVSVGDDFVPRKFSVYCAKSIAGIALEKHLPDTTISRGIMFNMRRKLPHEKVERFRNADTATFDDIKSKLTRFAQDNAEQLKIARPPLPDELSDRDQDKWEPLLAIAECAGEEWLKRATDAALELSNVGETPLCKGAELLEDIQYIFDCGEYPGKISTVDLIEALCKDEEAPWVSYNYGKSITPRQLANLLKPYDIKSKTVRMEHGSTPKGYDAAQFEDAFARYLGPKLPQQRND